MTFLSISNNYIFWTKTQFGEGAWPLILRCLYLHYLPKILWNSSKFFQNFLKPPRLPILLKLFSNFQKFFLRLPKFVFIFSSKNGSSNSPNAQTSLLWVNILFSMHSRANHLMGILPPAAVYASSLTSKNLAKPKSVILMQFGFCRSTLRAAKSRCIILRSSK